MLIQGDNFNRSSINTVMCAVITSNINLANAPANFILEKTDSGLEKSSVVNFSQILTLDKGFLTQMISMLPKSTILKMNKSLKTRGSAMRGRITPFEETQARLVQSA